MRTIQTFILRLLTNTDEPHVLRGVVTAIADGEAHTFRDGESLLDWLQSRNDPARDEQQSVSSDAEVWNDAR
jgi:hypothetical protein